MADTKISAMTTITGANIADGDLVPVVDVSDTTGGTGGTNKILTASELGAAIGANGRLVLSDYTSTTPSLPTSGVKMFSRYKAGRHLPAYVGPSGIDTQLQPHFGSNCVAYVRPTGNGTVVTTQGIAVTATGTATAANWATTNALTSLKRISYISSTTAGSAGGWREAVLKYWRGNGSGLGGFYVVARFGFNSIPATRAWFVGFTGVTTALAAATAPSANTNIIGVGQDSSDTAIQFMHNGTGTATKSSSGLTSPAVGEVYEVRIFAAPNSTHVQMSVEKLFGGSYAEYDSLALTTIPATTQGLAIQMWASNVSTAAAIDMHVVSYYIETDN